MTPGAIKMRKLNNTMRLLSKHAFVLPGTKKILWLKNNQTTRGFQPRLDRQLRRARMGASPFKMSAHVPAAKPAAPQKKKGFLRRLFHL